MSLAMAQDCPASNAALTEPLDAAHDAFMALDPETFEAERKRMWSRLKCLSEPIDPSNAAAVHRVQAFFAYLNDQTNQAQLGFAASRRLEPDFVIDESVAPEGHPLHDDFFALDASAERTKPLPALSSGAFWVDGTKSMVRPANHPTVFQYVAEGGKDVQSSWLEGSDALPLDSVAIAKPKPVEPKPVAPVSAPEPVQTARKRRRPNIPLVLTGVGAGVAASGLLVANRMAFADYNQTFDDLETAGAATSEDRDALDRKRGTTNALGMGAAGLGVVAVGVGVTGFVLTGTF